MRVRVGQVGHRDDDGGPEKRRDAIVEGLWWPPSDERLRARGTVSAFADGSVWLDTETDPWSLVTAASEEPRADFRILHGETATGAPLSLHGVRLVGGEREHFTGQAHVRFVADRLIIGAAAKDETEVALAFLRISFRGLREWLMGWTRDTSTPLPQTAPPSGADHTDTTKRLDNWLRSVSITVDDVQLEAIVSRGPTSSSRFRSVYDTSAWLQLTSSQPQSLADWRREWIEPLRSLVQFGTREQTVLLSLDGTTETGPAKRTVKVIMAPEVALQPPQHTPYYQRDLLPAGIWDEDGFEELIASWRNLHLQLGAVAQGYFELANTVDVPPLTRLLRLSSCAEGYHRVLHDKPPFSDDEHEAMRLAMVDALPEDQQIRAHYRDRLAHANSQSQRQRIRWLIERASEVDERLAGRAKELTGRLVGWRNEHTHLDESATVPPVDDLLLLNAVLGYVMDANILLDIGMDANARYCLACGYVWDDPVAALADEA